MHGMIEKLESCDMTDARNKAKYQGKIKKLAYVFAQKTIATLELIIADTVMTLLNEVDGHEGTGEPINMRRYLNHFTIDVFSHLLYGDTQGCLEWGSDMVKVEITDGKVYEVPFIKSLHDATIINTILGMEASLLPLTS